MTRKKYALRTGFGVSTAVPVEVVLAELTRIEDEHEQIAPEIVVDEARPADAPLHPAFEWDNDKASEQYRLIQARNLIRAVHVVGADGQGASVFAHVTIEQDRGYRSVARIVGEAALFDAALDELRAKLDGAAKAVRDLEAAASGKPSEVRKRLRKARTHAEAAPRALAARRAKRTRKRA